MVSERSFLSSRTRYFPCTASACVYRKTMGEGKIDWFLFIVLKVARRAVWVSVLLVCTISINLKRRYCRFMRDTGLSASSYTWCRKTYKVDRSKPDRWAYSTFFAFCVLDGLSRNELTNCNDTKATYLGQAAFQPLPVTHGQTELMSNHWHTLVRCNSVYQHLMWWWWWWLILADEDFGEGWGSILTRSLVAVESDSWCAHLTPNWTDEGLGWGWLGCCSLFLPSAFSFAASCLSASNLQLAFLTDTRQLSRPEASCCHVWCLIPACASCLFSWSL